MVGLLHGLAIVFHQEHVPSGVVVLAALWLRRRTLGEPPWEPPARSSSWGSTTPARSGTAQDPQRNVYRYAVSPLTADAGSGDFVVLGRAHIPHSYVERGVGVDV